MEEPCLSHSLRFIPTLFPSRIGFQITGSIPEQTFAPPICSTNGTDFGPGGANGIGRIASRALSGRVPAFSCPRSGACQMGSGRDPLGGPSIPRS
jgi:hypothetical protein